MEKYSTRKERRANRREKVFLNHCRSSCFSASLLCSTIYLTVKNNQIEISPSESDRCWVFVLHPSTFICGNVVAKSRFVSTPKSVSQRQTNTLCVNSPPGATWLWPMNHFHWSTSTTGEHALKLLRVHIVQKAPPSWLYMTHTSVHLFRPEEETLLQTSRSLECKAVPLSLVLY